jgi:phage terminase large subunit GpA-like protein
MNLPTKRPLQLPEGLADAWRLDCEAFAAAIRPDPRLTISEWADRYRILSPESSKEPGPWRTDRVPHSKAIMDALSPSDPCQEVTFVAGTQVAKTEIGNNFIGYIIDVSPAPAMMVYPTSATGKRTSKTRIAKMIEAMPRLSQKISDASRDGANSQNLKMFPGGLLVTAGANSAAELKMQPVRFVFEDEVDEYPDDVEGQGPADVLAEKRTDTYESSKKIYRASTTTRKASSKIWRHLGRSNLQRRNVPCPHCNAMQVLRWQGFRYEVKKIWTVTRDDDGEIVQVPEGTEGAKSRDTDEVQDVWYECAHCQGRIEERHKPWMFDNERARWVAENPHITRHQGFHLPTYYSPLGWFPWRKVVEERLKADKDPTKKLLQVWYNTIDATPYEGAVEKVSDLELRRRAREAKEPYSRGTVPQFALLLTASVDVQANRLEVKVKGYGRDRESCLVDYEVIFGDTETRAPWAALDEFRRKRFRHASGAELRITAMGVDAGYRTQTVYDYCRPRNHEHVLAMRGQSQAGKTILGRPTKQDIDHQGLKIPNGIDLWPIGADTAKGEIYARLRIGKPGPGYMHFPTGLPDEYYRGLTAERLVTHYVKGYLRTHWEKDETDRNEPLDLEVYAYAAAIYAGINRINWDRLEATLRATVGDLFVDAAQRERDRQASSAADAGPAQAVQTSAHESEQENDAGTDAVAAPPKGREGWVPERKGWLERD